MTRNEMKCSRCEEAPGKLRLFSNGDRRTLCNFCFDTLDRILKHGYDPFSYRDPLHKLKESRIVPKGE